MRGGRIALELAFLGLASEREFLTEYFKSGTPFRYSLEIS